MSRYLYETMATIRVAARKIQLKKMESVHRERTLKRGKLAQPVGGKIHLLPHQRHPGEDFSRRDQQNQVFALPGLHQQIEQQHGAAEQRQHDRGNQHEMIACGIERAHRTPATTSAGLVRAACAAPWKYPGRTRSTICATGFSRISKYGLGYTPIHRAQAISGRNTASSRGLRSARCRFLPLVTCPSMVRWYSHNR